MQKQNIEEKSCINKLIESYFNDYRKFLESAFEERE